MQVKALLLFTLLWIIASCKHPKMQPAAPKNKNQVESTIGVVKKSDYDDYFIKLKLSNSDSVISQFSSTKASVYLANKYYSLIVDTGMIDFFDVQEKYLVSLYDFGEVIISEVNIRGKYLSNVVPKRCYVLYSKRRSEAYIFCVNKLHLIKRKKSDTAYYLGGIPISKGIGYFLVYSFNDTTFVRIFDSGMEIEDGTISVPVYLNNDDCIQYSKDFLEFKNLDFNNDGLWDLLFEGTIKYYCNPNEYGIDNRKRIPLRQVQAKVGFIYSSTGISSRWILFDTTKVKLYFEYQ
jgi:hypothetical protein